MSLARYTQAKSVQLNADDLVGGNITVQIERVVDTGAKEQPVHYYYTGCNNRPWKPSKTMIKILAGLWGDDEQSHVGRWVELFRNPKTRWAGVEVGGVEIKAMSHIKAPATLVLNESKHKKKEFKIGKLNEPEPQFYDDAYINSQLQPMTDAILGGQATHEQVIAQLEQSAKLTDSQKTLINSIGNK